MNASPRVALFVTCLVNVFRPPVAEASVRLLRAAGCRVEVPATQTCCGQPGYNAGDIDGARPLARRTIALLEGYDAVVAPSGSCIGMLREHYPRLLADEPAWHARAVALAATCHEITSFLALRGVALSTVSGDATVTYHDSCAGLRELGIHDAPRALLAQAGIAVAEMDATDTCCGFGGTFCAKMPDISVAMADAKIAQAQATGATTLAGGDLGCLLHLDARIRERALALDCRHVVELLDGARD